MAPVVWVRFLLHDCVIEHRFTSREKPRECEVDGRCQGELYRVTISGGIEMSAIQPSGSENVTHPEEVSKFE